MTGLTDLIQIGYKKAGKKGWKVVESSRRHEKSRPAKSDLSIFYTKWCQLSPTAYLPMQFGKGV